MHTLTVSNKMRHILQKYAWDIKVEPVYIVESIYCPNAYADDTSCKIIISDLQMDLLEGILRTYLRSEYKATMDWEEFLNKVLSNEQWPIC